MKVAEGRREEGEFLRLKRRRKNLIALMRVVGIFRL